ncbi:glucosamine-6-phosphate deaminase [Billgrantia pellis]|uniref:Glucosamine-6-phosphate deaminase n=1 Tax=Billgrantia pellis TaxID=2606936 RepID=A0A7V7FZ58_9GAMM|nr:glucosamine-6-phosphate deaminase [Halomonas pellis]KAA0011942.1 glucosamine-6-phosphate deaminase [Halomonas pellis]
MDLIIVRNTERMARIGADLIQRQLATKPDSVLGLATGATPLNLYREMVARHRRGRLTLERAITFNLDEYLGLGPEHPASYASYMRRHLFGPMGLDPARAHLPNGTAAAPEAEAKCYEARLQAVGGIDLQLLGIGLNGHIGFNEPGSALDSRARVVCLSATTRAANQRYFPLDESTPTHAITLGIGTIMEARRLLLLASGSAKAAAVSDALEGPITPEVPASVVQRHPRVTVLIDAEAATALSPIMRRQAREPDAIAVS